MCPGAIGIMVIILIFLLFLVHTANASYKKKELRLYYEKRPIIMHTNQVYQYMNESMEPKLDKYKVTIIGAIHGNEPVGHHALTEMIEKDEFRKYYDRVDFFLFSDPNEYGRIKNKRHSPWGDLNRLWPKEYGPFDKFVYPIQTMLPYVHKVDLVIDIHEATGYNRCHKSLGNIIYISDEDKVNMINPIVDELNKKLHNEWNDSPKINKCDQWDIITKLPQTLNTTGTLDEYIEVIPEEHRPLYILIEIPGQNNIQPLEKRVRTAKFLIHKILEQLL